MNVVSVSTTTTTTTNPTEVKERNPPKERIFVFTEKYRCVTIVFSTNSLPSKPVAGQSDHVIVVRYGAVTYRPDPTVVPRNPRDPDYHNDNLLDPKDKSGQRLLPPGLKQVPTPIPPGFKSKSQSSRAKHRREAADRYRYAPAFGVVNLASFKKGDFPSWFRQQVRNLVFTYGSHGSRLVRRNQLRKNPAAVAAVASSSSVPQPQLEQEQPKAPSVQEEEEHVPQLLD